MFNSRSFRGNRNYISLYNSHLSEVFNYPQDTFKESKVSNDVLYQHQIGYPRFPGSRWTSEEKSMFFHYLARYSIHRLDLISENIPTKSSLEILQYYHVLNRALNKYKKVKKTHVRGKKFYYKHVSTKLLPYHDLPIAYEMSEEWIKAEEVQSWMATKKEKIVVRDETAKFPAVESDLIDMEMFEKWNALTKQYGGESAKVDYKSVKFYEKLIHLITREMMIYFLIRGTQKFNKLDFTRAINTVKGLTERYEPLVFAPKKTVTSIDDLPKLSKVVEDEHIEEQLFERETQEIDEKDMWESRGHEHILLTFMTTANYEAVKHSMYTDVELVEQGVLPVSVLPGGVLPEEQVSEQGVSPGGVLPGQVANSVPLDSETTNEAELISYEALSAAERQKDAAGEFMQETADVQGREEGPESQTEAQVPETQAPETQAPKAQATGAQTLESHTPQSQAPQSSTETQTPTPEPDVTETREFDHPSNMDIDLNIDSNNPDDQTHSDSDSDFQEFDHGMLKLLNNFHYTYAHY
ncbi:hypothetical protein CLIB1444_02S16600 [[Candida] jaroonii]|uniref:Uncharacterized protein n=1 Tax=[Candida] jaroonii TaxID=467808 RepID=A0ACA9Y565_9ASCO|nr:hypothetical protein CLIB1444_02S16600 [[Candida] jaroonii]